MMTQKKSNRLFWLWGRANSYATPAGFKRIRFVVELFRKAARLEGFTRYEIIMVLTLKSSQRPR